VEDDPLIRDLLGLALEEGGFKVLLAEDGRIGLETLERGREAIVGIATDVNLGQGPSGWEIGREGRRLNPNLAVVYMSGGSAHEWESEGVPNSTILVKPFAPAQPRRPCRPSQRDRPETRQPYRALMAS
jgi:two-component system cell cycle response regulator CpdR